MPVQSGPHGELLRATLMAVQDMAPFVQSYAAAVCFEWTAFPFVSIDQNRGVKLVSKLHSFCILTLGASFV